METNYTNQPRQIQLFDLLIVILGCGMLPLWALGLYYSFHEGPVMLQSLVMSSAALVVSICFMVATLLRREAATTALIFSTGFIAANLIYNVHSTTQLGIGFVLAFVFLFLPSLLLLLSSMPRSREQFFAAATLTLDMQTWSPKSVGLFLLCIVLLLVVLAGLYGLGFTA